MASLIPESLKYTSDHDWVSIDGDIATVGITDFAQTSLGDIVFVELPEVGDSLEKDGSFGVVESIKSVTDLHSPISGEVIEINEELTEQPELCNSAPYDSWMMKVKLSNSNEIEGLMAPSAYNDHCENA